MNHAPCLYESVQLFFAFHGVPIVPRNSGKLPKPQGQLGMAFETLGLPITAGGGRVMRRVAGILEST